MRRVPSLLLLLCAGCGSGYEVRVTVLEECPLDAATLKVTATVQPGNLSQNGNVANAPAFFVGDHVIVVLPPPDATALSLEVTALDASSVILGVGNLTVPISGHQRADATLTIASARCADGGLADLALADARPISDGAMRPAPDAAPDLASPDLGDHSDLASVDLAAKADLASADLALAPDLVTGCGGPDNCTMAKPVCCAGLCTDIETDPDNCGGCNDACVIPHAIPACAAHTCGIGQCLVGYLDCDGMSANGCESQCASQVCNGGHCEKRIFITSGLTTGGALGGLAGADMICNAAAKSAMLGGTWMAWLSSSTVSMATRVTTKSLGPYVLLDGPHTVVAQSWAALTSGNNLLHAIDVTEHGTPMQMIGTGCGNALLPVWTNTKPDGTLVSNASACKDWTMDAADGYMGDASTVNVTWTELCALAASCEYSASLYCIEQ